jgi:iron complex transport system ATP-binding protein
VGGARSAGLTAVARLLARDLAFEYPGPIRAVDGLDLAVEGAELVCLIGPNGCGKSTLLRLCAGLLAPSAGAVELDGRAVAGLEPRERARRIAFVPQGLRALPDLDARSFVLGGRYAHQTVWAGILARETRADREAVEHALAEADALDLAARRLDELSLGQFQRVRVARALAQEAPLFLFDEPTAALDPEQRARLWLRVANLRDTGGAVVFATQNVEEVEQVADRVAALREGRLVYAGSTGDYDRSDVESLSA